MHWRRKWQPTPVFLPGESQGQQAWWAPVYGVAQSCTWLKWLSSSKLVWHFPRRIQQLSFCYFQISLHLWPSVNPGITCPHPSEISQPCGPWSAKLPHKIMSAHSKNSGNVIFLLFGQDWGCENMLIPWAISSIFFLEQDRKKNKNKITHTHTN